MPHDGRARAGVPEPDAPEAGTTGTGAALTAEQAASGERALAFAGTALAAVYVADPDEPELRLLDSAGLESPERRLPPTLSTTGGSAAAHAFRTGRPL
ncbi:hypothetical protein [Streptomyces nigra]